MSEYQILGLPVLLFFSLVVAVLIVPLSLMLNRWKVIEPATIPTTEEIKNKIRKGLRLYVQSNYKILIGVALLIESLICLFAFHLHVIPKLASISFLLGLIIQAYVEYLSIKKGFESSIATIEESKKSLALGFKKAFRTAASLALLLNASVILSVFTLFLVSFFILKYEPQQIAIVVFTFCFGTSILSFFTKISSGIFTKSADIASDIVGKTELEIPENDPRNPAVIVNKIGNISNKIASTSSDTLESFSFSISASIVLALYAATGKPLDTKLSFISVPIVLIMTGTVISIISIFLSIVKDGITAKKIFKNIRVNLWIVYTASIISAYLTVYFLIPDQMGIFWSALSGTLAGIIICESSYYYTSNENKPTQRVINNTTNGASTVIINGLTIGIISSWIPTLCIILSIILAYVAPGGLTNTVIGLYGIGIACAGMLSTVVIIFTLNTYGNILDNASGISNMISLEPFIKDRVQNLDEIGLKSYGITKGTALAYTITISVASLCTFNLENYPITAKLLACIILGGLSIFILSGMIMMSISKTTHLMIKEIRKQFKEIQGLIEGETKPNYSACIQISNKGSKKGVILPMLLGFILPCLITILLGISGSVGLLIGAISTGFLFSIMLTTTGHIWSSTKRFIEGGKHGGINTPAHKAAVIADAVGAPLKDAIAPSINVFIKLILVISIISAYTSAQYSAMIITFIKNIRF
ncbi:MAG: sodium/proton-translocating pyrophosphatase [bacterium]